jgi:transposase InsO family protein
VECGLAIRVLSVVDAYTRECLALEVDAGFASRRVTRVRTLPRSASERRARHQEAGEITLQQMLHSLRHSSKST